MPFFSVIIPVYNAEQYLEKCLDSVFKQSYQDYEIFLIDDSSQDHSAEICAEICEHFSNIIYERIPHGGASAARNYGIQKAKGQYIVFIDADDHIAEDMLLELFKTISTGGTFPDICYMSRHYVESDNHCKINTVFQLDDTFIQSENLSVNKFFDIVTRDGNHIPGSTWLMICSTEFLKQNKILFDETLVWSEDSDFSFRALMCTDKIKCCDFCGYYYVDNGESVSKKVTASKVIGKMSVYCKWIFYFSDNSNTEKKYSTEICKKIVEQLLAEYCRVFDFYVDITDKGGRKLVREQLKREKKIWKQCNEKRYKNYVKFGIVLGTIIQELKKIVYKRCCLNVT